MHKAILKTTILIISLEILLLKGTFAFSFTKWKDTLYQGIKNEAEKSFSELFQQKVSIKKVGGILIGQIVLEEINLPSLGQLPKVVLTFNPFKYAYYRGDIIPALTKITVFNGKIKVARGQAGWNISSFLPQTATKEAQPMPFRGRVFFSNCQVSYRDEVGFRPQAKPFSTQITDLNGTIDLRKKDQIKFALSGKSPELVKIQGWYNLINEKYQVNLTADKINLVSWGNYLLPFAELTFSSGSADLFLSLSPPKTKGWPVALIGRAVINKAAGKFQNYKISQTSGELFMADENVAFSNFKTNIDQIPLVISGRLYNFSQLNLDLNISVPQAEFLQQKLSGE
ncbi:MAG: DUF748 domain-containing protein, partial [Candidatus Margulisiibacteriota bacterium]